MRSVNQHLINDVHTRFISEIKSAINFFISSIDCVHCLEQFCTIQLIVYCLEQSRVFICFLASSLFFIQK